LRLSLLSRPGYLSGFTQYNDGVYFGKAVRLVHGAIAYRDFAMAQPPGGTKPGHGTLHGQERDRREPNIGVGRQTSPYQAVTPPQAAVLRPRYRLSLVKHQRSLTMFLLTRAGNPARSVPWSY